MVPYEKSADNAEEWEERERKNRRRLKIKMTRVNWRRLYDSVWDDSSDSGTSTSHCLTILLCSVFAGARARASDRFTVVTFCNRVQIIADPYDAHRTERRIINDICPCCRTSVVGCCVRQHSVEVAIAIENYIYGSALRNEAIHVYTLHDHSFIHFQRTSIISSSATTVHLAAASI